jgi:hypothetical protein
VSGVVTTEQSFLILNPVRTERAEDFERYVREVIGPAVGAQQPAMLSKVRLWRASEPEPGATGILIYAFVVEGASSWEDLNLAPLFSAHYGDDEAGRLLKQFDEFFVDHGTWVESWSAHEVGEENGPQYGWQMEQCATLPT